MINPANSPDTFTAHEWLTRFAPSAANVSPPDICEAEFLQFDGNQRARLLPILWDYILSHRDSNDRDELTAVSAAIRKYIALMPLEQIGELSSLLESGHRDTVPLELEIEIAKMIYRTFEVHPPQSADPHPDLANQLLEIATAYTHPRILPRGDHSAAASLAILAVVAMQSALAPHALELAGNSPYRWFREIVEDDLERLALAWQDHPVASRQLSHTRDSITL